MEPPAPRLFTWKEMWTSNVLLRALLPLLSVFVCACVFAWARVHVCVGVLSAMEGKFFPNENGLIVRRGWCLAVQVTVAALSLVSKYHCFFYKSDTNCLLLSLCRFSHPLSPSWTELDDSLRMLMENAGSNYASWRSVCVCYGVCYCVCVYVRVLRCVRVAVCTMCVLFILFCLSDSGKEAYNPMKT